MASFLNVQSIKKQYSDTIALQELSFEIDKKATIVGILGRNGAGKSTFLKMLAGFVQPDSGQLTLTLYDQELQFASARHSTIISERSSVIPRLTGWQYLRFHESMNQLAELETDISYREHLIGELDLEQHLGKYIARMSKGNHRKVEIAAALSAKTPMVIADELGEGLDFPSLSVVCKEIRHAAENGRRFVISSHDLSFIGDLCDVVLVFDSGRCKETISSCGDLQDFSNSVKAAFASEIRQESINIAE